MLTYDNYLIPSSLEEALRELGDGGENVCVIAGATDILPWAREGRAGDVHYEKMIDISQVPELRGVSMMGGRLTMGATTTIGQFIDEPLLRKHAPLLARCAVWFADEQIREQATVGGNLVNASPAGDTMPALLAMNAAVTLHRLSNGQVVSRTLPLHAFLLGPGKNAMVANELLGSIEFDATPGYFAAFEKVGHRCSLAISTVCVAATVKPDTQRQSIVNVRIAIGGAGPVAERLPIAEAMLIGHEISGASIRAAAQTAAEHVRSRTRREYRREVVVNLVARAVANALHQSGVAAVRINYEEAAHV